MKRAPPNYHIFKYHQTPKARNRFQDEADLRSLRSFKTDFSNYLASDTNFLNVAEIMTSYAYGESNNANEKEVQCDLLTENGGIEIDPTRLSYRAVWVFLLLICATQFINQAVAVIQKYQKMDKITDIQLKFDTAPFPAITLCNLNPYKDSVIRSHESISKILGVFKSVMKKAGDSSSEAVESDDVYDVDGITIEARRRKRGAGEKGTFEPANSACECEEEEGSSECEERSTEKPSSDNDMCICAFDRQTNDAWPCHRREQWTNTTCQTCDEHYLCSKKAKKGTKRSEIKKEPCMCESKGLFCIKHEHAAMVLNLWEYFGDTLEETDITSEEREALGFGNMTDEVAIVTKAKENIIFAMSALSESQRILMSQAKHNLIHKCSFNGKPCDIDKDFELVADPTFGNCFVFNHDRAIFKSSLRAGPQYGLRVMLFVNASDYLPTSEAVGIRLTIHDKEDFPFPDTFGYSAPTGYISSFGMRMKKMSRLPAPYGDCVEDGTTSNYIYKGYAFSTEGCYRTCFQELIIDRCGCSDPRFPTINGVAPCQVFNKNHRECLEKHTHEIGEIHGSFKCRCQQPCNQTIYTTSYSEAIWPSQALNISLGHCEKEAEECNEEYKENAAMLEVFYEALNFEVLSESEAYGIVKMMADFGGHLGLWSGVSVMTCCEFVCLALELIYMAFAHHVKRQRLRRKEKEDNF
uniref:Degenerin n=1 Tax=Caenorhabditis japonica TaxID=281687 RepID=A0A8R1HXL4_CAEJA